MRIACYNIEWFNGLFDADDHPVADGKRSARYKISRAQQLNAIGLIFKTLDADAVMIVEAPDDSDKRSTVQALENFAQFFGLRTSRALLGFPNQTQQEIALLYDPKVVGAKHDPQGVLDGVQNGAQNGENAMPHAPRFDGVFRRMNAPQGAPAKVRFSKPPLEVALTALQSGQVTRLIGVHVKSKAPHGARDAADAVRIAIENRHKQMAQCMWLRARVDRHLAADENLIVLGDFNDGPGLDEYEHLFGRSGLEVVLGEAGQTPLYDPHAAMALSRRGSAHPVTSRFWLQHEKRYLQALLDYIMLSPGLRKHAPKWRIWHPFDDPECYQNPALRAALLAASDHFPVSVDLDL